MRKEGEITRREALQVMGSFAAGLGLLVTQGKGRLFRELDFPEEERGENSVKSYIAQKTENSCGQAAMAMVIADKKREDVRTVYKKITDYYEYVGKPDVRLGLSGLADYLKREGLDLVSGTVGNRWTIAEMQDHLSRYGSTIVDVTSEYGPVVEGWNTPNHWIIIDNIAELGDKTYAHIRDSLRSVERFNPREEIKPFMIAGNDGSIYVEADTFFGALGNNYIYFPEGSRKEYRQK